MRRNLPVLNDTPASSLRSDGRRNFVHPADVHGRFHSLRRVVFAVLIAILLGIPLLRIDGRPAIWLDIAHRRFYVFLLELNAQDFWLAFFLITGGFFALTVITTLWGRVFCGYACPHTVFLEGIYRPIERFIEGPRNERMSRNAGPASFEKLARKAAKHFAFVLVSLFIAHALLSYFVSLPAMVSMVAHHPSEHPEAFTWVMVGSAILYFHFAYFREQLCLVVCPYGRLQSALVDDDTLVIGYDSTRGEPRGKLSQTDKGDCVDCRRCVVVCPTGIDIRNGLQLECVGCAACVDACDEVMKKVGRAPGLIRYDSLKGFAGQARRFVRPRLFLYVVLGALGLVVASLAFQSRVPFEATLRRAAGAPFMVTDDGIVNPLRLHLVNKLDASQTIRLEIDAPDDVHVELRTTEIVLGSHESRYVPVVARAPRGVLSRGDELRIRVVATQEDTVRERLVRVPLLAPGS
ncbi:MAG: cytochrome c oxidase accessory protein CcoG [Polyangiaceae bacterium]|nr:cytochrome c oxidase accessory protein CcoG [Polyangiaceae bacterium]